MLDFARKFLHCRSQREGEGCQLLTLTRLRESNATLEQKQKSAIAIIKYALEFSIYGCPHLSTRSSMSNVLRSPSPSSSRSRDWSSSRGSRFAASFSGNLHEATGSSPLSWLRRSFITPCTFFRSDLRLSMCSLLGC